MKYNLEFLSAQEEFFAKNSKPIDLEGMSDVEKIEYLQNAGSQGANICTEIGGKKYYSFYSEEEMFDQVFGMSKKEYYEKLDSATHQMRAEKNRLSIDYGKMWKPEFVKYLPEEQVSMLNGMISKAVKSEDINEVRNTSKFIYGVYNVLAFMQDNNNTYSIYDRYNFIGKSSQERLDSPLMYFLLKSNVADRLIDLVYEDVAKVYGETQESVVLEILEEKMSEHEKKLAERAAKQFGEQ